MENYRDTNAPVKKQSKTCLYFPSNSGLYFLLAVFTLLVVSCAHEKKPTPDPLLKYGTTFENIMKSDSGIFRGINLGTSFKVIKTKELSGLDESDSNYLYYTLPLDTAQPNDTVNYYTVAYNFDESGLNEIDIDIFLENETQARLLFNTFKLYFDNKYGRSSEENNLTVWTTTLKPKGKAKITLTDDSEDYAFGKLSLTIYNPDN